MTTSNESLMLGLWNLVRSEIITVSTNYVRNSFYKSTVTNMATVWNLEVMSDKL